MLFFYYFMKMSGKQKKMNPGSKKHRSHKFTVVETKIAVPRHSRIDESLSRPKADQLGIHSHGGGRREPTRALEIHLL